MNAYPVGEPAHLTAAFTNLAGTLTDATVALTIRTPDGVETDYSASIVHDSTGTYHYDYTTAQAGPHIARWVASGALVAALEDTFAVLRKEG